MLRFEGGKTVIEGGLLGKKSRFEVCFEGVESLGVLRLEGEKGLLVV